MELDYTFMADTFFKIWSGIGTTLSLTVLSLLIAAPVAFYMAVLRIRGNSVGSGLTQAYISFVRGTPIVLQILLLYSLLPSFLNMLVKSMGSNFNVFDSIDPFWYAVVVFSLNTIALLAEVFRSALLSIPKGQLEAGVSIGLSEFQTYRKIIIPQAIRAVLPALGNEFIVLLKDTSLITVIGGKELLYAAQGIMNRTYDAMFPLLGVAAIYLVLVMLLTWLLGKFERRLAQSDR